MKFSLVRMAVSTASPKNQLDIEKHEVLDASTVKFEDWYDEEIEKTK